MGRRTKFVDSDILVIGGGFGGCGAAYESRHWGRDLKIVLVEKANIERSGAVAQGLSAINCYMGMQWGENQPEDFVRYSRGDLMGPRERGPRLRYRPPRRFHGPQVRGVGPADHQEHPDGPVLKRRQVADHDSRRELQADRRRSREERLAARCTTGSW
jgi:glycine/D-amino acid oxidase-like deaminating enzyme